MNYRKIIFQGAIVVLLAASPHLRAQSSSCNGYRLLAETIASAGGASSGGDYKLVDTAGQSAVGNLSNFTTYSLSAGNADAFKDPLPVWSSYSSWKQAFFTPAQQSDPSVSGALADPDHDGIANLEEYAMYSDPTSSASASRPFVEADATNLYFTYQRSLAASDVTFSIEESTDLFSWMPVSTISPVTCQDGFAEAIEAQVPRADAGTAGKLFLRLRVTQ